MATDDASTQPTENTPSRRMRWWTAVTILIGGAALQTAAMVVFAENRSYLAWACVFFIWPLTALLLLLWWTFWSRLPWRTRWQGLIVVAAIKLTLLAAVRFDGFDGAMLPMFSPRWQVTKAQRAQEFFQNNQTATPGVPAESFAEVSLVPTKQDWPEFRGPNRDDVVIGESLRTDWNARPPKQLWKHPIGSGWSAFAVIGRRAWTLEQRGEKEMCVCYDVETGQELWSHTDAVRFETVQGGIGPHSTPTVHDGKVYTQGATGILNCLHAGSGQRLWTRNTLEDAGTPNVEWGQVGSPLIVDDFVIVSPGSNDKVSKAKRSSVIAYQKDHGEIAWTAESRQGSYGSPHAATFLGERQVLIFDGLGIVALEPKTGAKLWEFEWINTPQINASQPLLVDDRSVLIGSGYGLGSVLLGLSRTDAGWTSTANWKSKQFKLKFNGAVRLEDYLYGLDEGLLTCLSLKDGQRRWKHGRYGYGQILLVEDKLLILTEEGDVVLVPATPESPCELSRFHAIDGKTWNHPVLSRGRLLIRNSDEAACFDLR